MAGDLSRSLKLTHDPEMDDWCWKWMDEWMNKQDTQRNKRANIPLSLQTEPERPGYILNAFLPFTIVTASLKLGLSTLQSLK